MSMSIVLCHLVSLASKVSVIVAVESCFRCGMGRVCHGKMCLLHMVVCYLGYVVAAFVFPCQIYFLGCNLNCHSLLM